MPMMRNRDPDPTLSAPVDAPVVHDTRRPGKAVHSQQSGAPQFTPIPIKASERPVNAAPTTPATPAAPAVPQKKFEGHQY